MTQIGAVLAGKYKVLAKLGEGGMGSVFRAENQVTGKQVALKCLHAHVTATPESSERLLREARAASSLSHPNVVDVYDVVRDGETLFLVMELLRGQTLRDHLAENPQPKISEFIALMLPALAGVAAAHARGVIHRDLKPDNIFLAQVADTSKPVAKVLDFGIAKLAAARGPTLTQTGVSLGTPLYMSLEQLRGDKDIDQRADVYAFGVMFYEAVTGSLPHDAETLPELAIKVATTDPLPVKARRPDVPTPLARLIDSAVTRDRNQRPPSVRALMQELEVFARDYTFRDQMTHPEAPLPRLAADPAAPQPIAEAPTTPARGVPPAAAGRVPSALGADPDTFRVRELISSVPPSAARTRRTWTLLAAAAAGLVLAGAWVLGGRAATEATDRNAAATAPALEPPAQAAAPAPPIGPAQAAASAQPVGPARSAAPAQPIGPAPLAAPGIEHEPVASPSDEPGARAAEPARPAQAGVATPKEPAPSPVQPPERSVRAAPETPAQPPKLAAQIQSAQPVKPKSVAGAADKTAPASASSLTVSPVVTSTVRTPPATVPPVTKAVPAPVTPTAKTSPASAPAAPVKKKSSLDLVGF